MTTDRKMLDGRGRAALDMIKATLGRPVGAPRFVSAEQMNVLRQRINSAVSGRANAIAGLHAKAQTFIQQRGR